MLLVAAALCWVPFLALVVVTVATWPLLAGEISTQWSGDDVVTRAQGWTVLLLPVTGTLVCGVIATVVAVERPRHHHRATLAVCGAVGAVLLGVVVAVVLANR